MLSPEIEFWKRVADDLGIEIITPFETTLSDGSQIAASALVKDFGLKRGMVVSANFAVLSPHADRLIEDGYGYSSNLGRAPQDYKRDSMIEVLADWKWSGDPAKKPDWLP
jgi:hypothetical protein